MCSCSWRQVSKPSFAQLQWIPAGLGWRDRPCKLRKIAGVRAFGFWNCSQRDCGAVLLRNHKQDLPRWAREDQGKWVVFSRITLLERRGARPKKREQWDVKQFLITGGPAGTMNGSLSFWRGAQHLKPFLCLGRCPLQEFCGRWSVHYLFPQLALKLRHGM